MKEIASRLRFLTNVGLDYLSLDRSAETLSGGEAQRIRLASQIGSGLTGVMYVLDEPSIGLHQRDNSRLLDTLKHLRDLGNSVIVVEHDEEAIGIADHVIDMGPGAGVHGGQIMAEGTPQDIKQNPASLTGQYLSGVKRIEIPQKRVQPDPERWLTLTGAVGNNLKSVTLKLPVGLLVCVTGVSGSGKSTLINDTLYPAIAQHLYGSSTAPAAHEEIDGPGIFRQGDRRRSKPDRPHATLQPRDLYRHVHTDSRVVCRRARIARAWLRPGALFFQCQRRALRGVPRRRHAAGGNALPARHLRAVRRLPQQALQPRDAGNPLQRHDYPRSVGHDRGAGIRILQSCADGGEKLSTLLDVGLGYITLGQSATTLSGGEAQRVKLALELSKRDTGRTLYILDEPTTGLHFQDIQLLLTVVHRLRDHGNTVVVIEHNLDVIKTADWIIDLGPEGGDGGGQIIAQGTPEQIAQTTAGYTGHYLKQTLASTAGS